MPIFALEPVPAGMQCTCASRRRDDHLARRLGGGVFAGSGGRSSQPSVQVRQRAVKNDQSGNPLMVMELTQTRLAPGHEVNVQGVLLEMRKAVQVNFAKSGFQSVCTHVRDSKLSVVPALETTCTVTQNGVHVLTQTLVAAANKEKAWSLSYAGSAEGYAANKDEALQIRESLRLDGEP